MLFIQCNPHCAFHNANNNPQALIKFNTKLDAQSQNGISNIKHTSSFSFALSILGTHLTLTIRVSHTPDTKMKRIFQIYKGERTFRDTLEF